MSLVPLPAADDLPGCRKRSGTTSAASGSTRRCCRRGRASRPRAVPERIGEPSLIRHVVYVIKENRTYDQVLGDMAQGNGDPRLCIFGERITPNQHKLAREFVLLDNTYCAGILSADGHQWSTSGVRHRLPGEVVRRLSAQLSGRHGRGQRGRAGLLAGRVPLGPGAGPRVSLRNYGEFMGPAVRWRDAGKKGEPDFLACYRTWQRQERRRAFRVRAADSDAAAALSDGLRGLVHGRARPVPGRLHPAGAARVRGARRVSRAGHHLPAQRSYQRHEARLPHAGGARWPTTTWPSGGWSRG